MGSMIAKDWQYLERYPESNVVYYVGVILKDIDNKIRNAAIDIIDDDEFSFDNSDNSKIIGRVYDNKIILSTSINNQEILKNILDDFNIKGEWEMVIPEYLLVNNNASITHSNIVGAYRDGRKTKPLWIPKHSISKNKQDSNINITAIFAGSNYMICNGWYDGYSIYRIKIINGKIHKKHIDIDNENETIIFNIKKMKDAAFSKLLNSNTTYFHVI